ncbi:MAG: acyl-CoA dehydratase activase-related protein [Defluviitaleaceae bacterium]|nr:acyl-CoA dehydratase activase-related protein [Defluviitaleaceae bacterium]
MKIGIPRALLYYFYEDLWLNFFKNINVETIVSPETNKEIIRKGVRDSIDESCFSSKIFIGHVEYLIDKCDMIFVPRIENSAIMSEYCTAIFGLYDLVRNTFPNAKLLHADVNYLLRKKEAAAFISIGETLNKSKEEAEAAYKAAVLTANILKQDRITKQEALLNSDDPKILIFAHAYNTFDASIGKVVTDFCAENGIQVIYADLVNQKPVKSKVATTYGAKVYWKVTAELLAGVETYKDRVDGIVLISAFPCGPDSIFNELLIRVIKDKPILSLVIDEQDASTGIQTRLESFTDIIMAKRRGHM